jgi:hypothetical protein
LVLRHFGEPPCEVAPLRIGRCELEDSVRIWAFRYSSEGDSRTLFYSTDVETLELMYPDSPACAR